jgi:phospho-N-acetylmuramoyl-pentapeptide-transferase
VRVILIAGAIALLVSLFGTPLLIRILAKRGFGQVIRDDGPTSHHTKRGTPTMGGIVIIVATVIAYAIAHLFSGRPPTVSALLVIGLVIALGLIGFLDDYLKIYINNQKTIVARMTMKAMLEKLPSTEFMRVHRSFIVPIKKVESLRNKMLQLGDKKIPVGNSYEEDVLKHFNS